MQWLPPSAEGKQLVGFGLASVLVGFIIITLLQFLAATRNAELQARELLQSRAVGLAAWLEKNPGLPPMRERIVELKDFMPHAEVYVADDAGTIVAATRADLAGQRWHASLPGVAHAWVVDAPCRAVDFSGTVHIVSRQQGTPPGTVILFSLGACVVSLLICLPFFFRLTRDWLVPVHAIAECDRRRADPQSGQREVLEPSAVPSGDLREVVTHRNILLDTLTQTQEALSRRTSDMEVLYEFSREVGLSREAPHLPGLALAYLARSVDYHVACMLVFHEGQYSLTVRSRASLSELLAAEVEHVTLESYYEKSGVLIDGSNVATTSVVGDVRAPRLEGRVRSAHWSAITVERKQVGVIGMMTLGERSFSTDAVRLLNILAQNTSLALEKLHVMRIEETQRFRNVLENLDEGVVLVRNTGEWALATGTARSFHADICGAEASGTALHSRECPIGLLGLDVFHGGQPITREITRQERTFILQGTFVRSSAAGEQGAVISIRDVTEERATQQHLFQASKLASLGELAAGVAHEVNNPLTGILGFTELLLARDDLPDEVSGTLQDIHSLARRTTQITMDLLIFARVQREGGFRAVDVRPVIRDTVKLIETSYRNLNLDLVEEMGPDDGPLLALGDRGKIQQVVMNLAQNAKDAVTMSARGSRITFRCYRRGDEIVIEVEDDGPGIPDRIRSRILEPFFTTKPVGKGTGLGLAIVSRLVEEHKGRLAIDTEDGRGTCFRISLPAASSTVEPEGDDAAGTLSASVQHPLQVSGVVSLASSPAPTEVGLIPLAGAGAAGRPQPETVLPPPPVPVPAPVADPVASSTPAPGSASHVAPAKPKKTVVPHRGCLVVLDDEETVLKFIARALQSDGWQVHVTTHPDEAMALITEHRPDMLFLDFRMPHITGEEFYRLVVASDARWARRVVFLTGDASGDEIQGFLRETGAPALSKPIGIKDLRSFVVERLAWLKEQGGEAEPCKSTRE